jgi:nanoRNase/pAp phosphatase (c-di-AMP/oligoRNAs hydrolase)
VEAFSRALIDAITKYRNIIIVIKGSPDPDAIASSYALSALCRHLKVSSSIVASKKLSLPENRAFASIMGIPLKISLAPPDIKEFDAYIVADHQSPAAHELVGSLPCAAFIDHHEPTEEEISADFILRKTEAGSTSTLIALLFKHQGIELEPEVMKSVSTALLYGIYTDTDKYSHAGELDYEALDYLSKYSDHEVFNRISSTPLSRKTLQLLKKAIENKTSYKDWLIAGIGYVDAESRDSIAIVADFLLKRETFNTVIVFAAIEDAKRGRLTLDASFRSASGSLNLNDVIKKITPEGGARKFKGAYQVDIDYFNHCPDRKLLWDVIYLSTVELLKKSRDELYITELKGFYQKFKKKMHDYFS